MGAMNGVHETIRSLQEDAAFMSCVTRWERMDPRPGICEPLPDDIDPRVRAALEARGVDSLYSHQAESYRAARSGRDFVVVTPTASGKTLCYNLAVLQSILEAPESRALDLFPTKALSQDQQSELNESVLAGELAV